MGKEHIIELNGQRYDARTGAIVSSTPVSASRKTAKKASATNMDGFSRAPKQSLPHRQTEKSKTLMRKVVSKPSSAPTPKAATTPRITTSSLGSKHVKSVPKSPLVSRFGKDTTPTPTKPLPTKADIAITATGPTKSDDPITKALAAASSQKQPKLKKARLSHRVGRKLHVSPRLVSVTSFAAAFLLIAGFFTYQNIPGLTMRLASSRSGVQGSLPGYSPAGFNLNGSIGYKPGQITVNYKSNSDDRSYKVTQANSSWNTEALQEQFVKQQSNVLVAQEKGKTIYLYNDNNATWVDGGVWYRIEGDSQLSGKQLQDIAASL